MTNRCYALWLVWLLIIASSCASTPIVQRGMHEADWLLAETAHIELRTDLDPKDAKGRARQLEQYWQALALMYGAVAPGRPAPTRRFAVIHFHLCRDMMQLGRNGQRGFVLRAPYWTSQPIAVTCEGHGDSTLLHELAHIFNAHHVPTMSVWLNEGLAAYYESLTVSNGKAIIGIVPRRLTGACADTLPPGLDELRHMGSEEFHEESDEWCHYLSAWKLIHMLSGTSPELMRRFHVYIAALRRGSSDDQSWQEAFSDLPIRSLAEDYDRYGHGGTLGDGWSASYQWAEPSEPRMRSLRPAEVRLLVLYLLMHRGEPALVDQQLDRMAEVDPDSPELLYWRAVSLRTAAAIPLLREYLARRPADERAWRALVSLRLREVTPRGYLGLGRSPPTGLNALELDVLELSMRASDPSSLNLVGWYHALRQTPIAGLPFAARSVRMEPGCGGCWDTLALLFFQAGRVASALEAQERAVNLLAEDAGPAVLTRLRRYRATAATRSAAPEGQRSGSSAPAPPPR